MKKLSVEPYKGVRDFYPEETATLNFIFDVWKKTAKSFGYVEYSASPLESSELYKAKSGEEIVNEQTYTFMDRGEREVTLRPEMTPTVARMISARKRDLGVPIRWFSIPNLFRYEQPQKGRLREHFQLNVDIFGVEGVEADIEILSLAHAVFKNFGAKDESFEIRFNSRKLLDELFSSFKIKEESRVVISKILDKKEKISKEVFEDSVRQVLGENAEEFIYTIEMGERILERVGNNNEHSKKIREIISRFEALGIKNIVFTPTIVRGFDYYTDIVFEIFDNNPENKRSLVGGGRYDNLLDIFGGEKMPAVGFGMGDLTMEDFLRTNNLLPEYSSSTQIYICRATTEFPDKIEAISNKLREYGLNVAIDLTKRKMGDQIKAADKMKIPFVICIGEEEISSNIFKVKKLKTGEEKELKLEEIKDFVSK